MDTRVAHVQHRKSTTETRNDSDFICDGQSVACWQQARNDDSCGTRFTKKSSTLEWDNDTERRTASNSNGALTGEQRWVAQMIRPRARRGAFIAQRRPWKATDK
jgi:hypothetical protein